MIESGDNKKFSGNELLNEIKKKEEKITFLKKLIDEIKKLIIENYTSNIDNTDGIDFNIDFPASVKGAEDYIKKIDNLKNEDDLKNLEEYYKKIKNQQGENEFFSLDEKIKAISAFTKEINKLKEQISILKN